MKHSLRLCSLVSGCLMLGSLAAKADPVLYISNQTCFTDPLVYVWGLDVPDDYSTYFDFGYDGYSTGTVTYNGLKFDKFVLPADAVGKTANVQYSNNWSNNKPDFEMTFEDKAYYLIARGAGLQYYQEGGVNEYVLLYLNNETTLEQDKNSMYVYAHADGAPDLLGEYPGTPYSGATDYIDNTGYYLYDMPKSDIPYTFVFSNPEADFKLDKGLVLIPNQNHFVKITDDSYEILPSPFTASFILDNICYDVDKLTGNATLTGLFDNTIDTENLVVPATVELDGTEYKVTAIADGAFKGLRNITGTLTLGENLVTIGNSAFDGCQNISGDLVIPDKVTTIGNSAFSACLGFEGTLTLGSSVETIGANAFLFTNFKGDLIIPDATLSIGEGAFNGCSDFDGTLTLGSKLQTISKHAFMSCSGLKGNLVIPESVTTLSEAAFMSCSGFDGTLALPSTLTSIDMNVFFNCSGLSGTLSIPEGVTEIKDGAFFQCSSLEGTLTIPAAVTSIGAKAFFGCESLFTLELGESLVYIGDGAFMNCKKLWGWLNLPAKLETIDDNAFCFCEKLTGPLTIPNSVTYIGSMAFAMCEGFNGKLTIGENVKTIGDQAFVSCSGLTGKLVIPEGVKTLGFRTFAWCWSLTELELPSTLNSLGNLAIYQCWNLKSITCNAEVPPVIADNESAFCSDNYTDATLYVPIHSIEAYKAAHEWSDFMHIKGIGAIDATDITLSQTELTLIEGETATLTATILPEDTTDKTIVWASSDEDIVTVADGVVTAVAKGTAVVTATCGDVSATCTVTVDKSNGVESIVIDNVDAEYFNLQGQPITAPAKGSIVIEKTARGSRKVLMK